MGQSRAVSPPRSIGAAGSLWLCPGRCRRLLLADGPAANCTSSSRRPEGAPVGRARFKLKGFKSLCTCHEYQHWPGLRPGPCAAPRRGWGDAALLLSPLLHSRSHQGTARLGRDLLPSPSPPGVQRPGTCPCGGHRVVLAGLSLDRAALPPRVPSPARCHPVPPVVPVPPSAGVPLGLWGLGGVRWHSLWPLGQWGGLGLFLGQGIVLRALNLPGTAWRAASFLGGDTDPFPTSEGGQEWE